MINTHIYLQPLMSTIAQHFITLPLFTHLDFGGFFFFHPTSNSNLYPLKMLKYLISIIIYLTLFASLSWSTSNVRLLTSDSTFDNLFGSIDDSSWNKKQFHTRSNVWFCFYKYLSSSVKHKLKLASYTKCITDLQLLMQ